MDDYYRDQVLVPETLRGNFDHPLALDAELFSSHLSQMRVGQDLEVPVYEFSKRSRSGWRLMEVAPILIVEGHLLFHDEQLRQLFDVRVFVETPADVRLARRILRDCRERGRSHESVIAQYLETVAPMHRQYVQPLCDCADLVVSGAQDPQEMLAQAWAHLQRAKNATRKG